jgi:hypothetical protein
MVLATMPVRQVGRGEYECAEGCAGNKEVSVER